MRTALPLQLERPFPSFEPVTSRSQSSKQSYLCAKAHPNQVKIIEQQRRPKLRSNIKYMFTKETENTPSILNDVNQFKTNCHHLS